MEDPGVLGLCFCGFVLRVESFGGGFHSVGGNETPTLGGPQHDFLSLGPNRQIKHQQFLQNTSHGARGAFGLAFPL